ncbi:MAG: TonB-dependent receptor plug domain-containing protein [Opitutaceae bacterium]|nr:TonB-dependent receptor plug domain-containing protein [Opitutaceae bacterium]
MPVFEVASDKDVGYQATSTLSGTRTNEQLRNLPVAVSVLNQEFLRDIAATNPMQAFEYGIGVDVNPTGLGVDGVAGNDGGNRTVVRGIDANWQGRDGFIWYAVSDNYNIESIELMRGPTGNVFGSTRAGGLPNIVSKRAKLRNFGELGVRWDSEGSQRATIDVNRQVTGKAAVRVNLMTSDKRDWRDTNYDRRKGAALAFQYEFSNQTRLSVVGEYNDVERVPRFGQPTDNFSSGYGLGSGTSSPGSIAGTGTIQGAGNTQRWTYIGGKPYNLISSNTRVFRQTTVAAPNQFAVAQNIIPRHMQWNGPSDRLDHDSKTLTASLEHRVGPNTILQAAFNHTLSGRMDFRANADNIRRDVNPNLPGPGGTLLPNPNFDQLYVEHRWTQRQFDNRTNSYRLTGAHDFAFRFTKQRLILNGTLQDDRFRLFNREEQLTRQAIAAQGLTGAAALSTNNVVRRRHYLKDGNDGALRYTGFPESDFFELSTGSKTRAFFYTGSALLLGRYWEDRVLSTFGVRRDDFEQRNVLRGADPSTNLGRFLTGANGEEVWREAMGVWRTSLNYGIVISPMRQWRVFANYGENFLQAGTGPYFNGDPRIPRIGDGYDFGASVYLWNDRVTATLTQFDNRANHESVVAINNQLTADEINRLLGTDYSTALNGDTNSRRTRGTELELVANPTRQWTLAFKYAFRKLENSDFAPRLTAVLAKMKEVASNPAQYELTETQLDELRNLDPNARAAWNFSTRYSFAQGFLKGARAGAYARYQQGRWVYPTGRPMLYFKGFLAINAFAGFEWKISGRYRADFQVNIENLTNDQTRVGANYTGYSYRAPTTFILQQRFGF